MPKIYSGLLLTCRQTPSFVGLGATTNYSTYISHRPAKKNLSSLQNVCSVTSPVRPVPKRPFLRIYLSVHRRSRRPTGGLPVGGGFSSSGKRERDATYTESLKSPNSLTDFTPAPKHACWL